MMSEEENNLGIMYYVYIFVIKYKTQKKNSDLFKAFYQRKRPF